MVSAAFVYTFLGIQIKIWASYGQTYCMLDCLHALEMPYCFGMVFFPLTLFGILSGKRMYVYPAFVLKYQNTSEIWNIFWRRILVKSVLFSFLFSSTACFLSGLSSYTVNNWDEIGSIFHQTTKTLYLGSAVYVIIVYVLFQSMKFCMGSIIVVFSEYLFQNSIWGIMLLVVFGVAEWVFSKWMVFFNLFSISQTHFITREYAIGILVFGCILLTVSYLIGRKIWKEKEFYGV